MSTQNTTNQHPPNLDEMLTAKDVAVLLNISPSHAYDVMRMTGKSFYLGRSLRIRRSDLEKFIEDQIKANNPSLLNNFMNKKEKK
jgi:predicted DNA-binding transcriptional regulator AlpA